jgi:hypothetical protein
MSFSELLVIDLLVTEALWALVDMKHRLTSESDKGFNTNFPYICGYYFMNTNDNYYHLVYQDILLRQQ